MIDVQILNNLIVLNLNIRKYNIRVFKEKNKLFYKDFFLQ